MSEVVWTEIDGGFVAENPVEFRGRKWRFHLGLERRRVQGAQCIVGTVKLTGAPAQHVGSPELLFRGEFGTMGEAMAALGDACMRAVNIRFLP